MVYINLFLTFLKIGAVSFGGGYAMISLIREKVMAYGWLSESELLNMIAVSESTPGPIAVNMATFVGSAQGGFNGSLLATIGVVLPSFVIILLISSIMRKFLDYGGVRAFLNGVRPCVVGLILATSFAFLLSVVFGIDKIGSSVNTDLRGILILLLIFAISSIIKKMRKKKASPILMIIISAVLGIILYSFN